MLCMDIMYVYSFSFSSSFSSSSSSFSSGLMNVISSGFCQFTADVYSIVVHGCTSYVSRVYPVNIYEMQFLFASKHDELITPHLNVVPRIHLLTQPICH